MHCVALPAITPWQRKTVAVSCAFVGILAGFAKVVDLLLKEAMRKISEGAHLSLTHKHTEMHAKPQQRANLESMADCTYTALTLRSPQGCMNDDLLTPDCNIIPACAFMC